MLISEDLVVKDPFYGKIETENLWLQFINNI